MFWSVLDYTSIFVTCTGQCYVCMTMGHSKNWPKGGRNSPNVPPRRTFMPIFLSLYCSQRVQKPLPDLYLLYFVQNFANSTAFDWFQDVK